MVGLASLSKEKLHALQKILSSLESQRSFGRASSFEIVFPVLPFPLDQLFTVPGNNFIVHLSSGILGHYCNAFAVSLFHEPLTFSQLQVPVNGHV